MPYRSFVFDNLPEDEIRCAAMQQVATRLTQRWNEINSLLERAQFARYNGYGEEDWIAEQADDNEQAERIHKEYVNEQRLAYDSALLELETIENQLAFLGARIMRPYEHWNEEERAVEYFENRYSYGD